ncbi:unnamed protein product [Rhodiola kirilowii]
MPTNTELITSHGNAIEAIEGRLGPMEDTLATVVSSIDRLTKSMEDLHQAFKNQQPPPPLDPTSNPSIPTFRHS